MKAYFLTIGSVISLLLISNCSLFDINLNDEPTKTKMEGIWESYLKRIMKMAHRSVIQSTFQSLHFSLKVTMEYSTAGPMTMYLVYGGSQYVKFASKIDQVFNYANLETNTGEWFIDNGYVDRFTIEMKLEGLPGQKTIKELLDLLNIATSLPIDMVIYHKFMDVKVSFDTWSDSTMTWEFDDQTTAEYNMKDDHGRYVSWKGWPTTSFSHCTFVLTKRVKDIEDLIKDQ